ncbi:uncharacterized protein TM35_000084420 [Trypanosoma theileri]|uniref:Mucin-associated surface protein (MASP) n=1 Tax=Trypanosoma theileri TaxID=67003 RepID=A0A1X0P127_9TRYP|nr:uncharacterized protein TM35_000084420 [Trypanosoma theileri]ORC90644.1 hypothetical protein TM35_000084420 [Trypanosoma theileri]
MTMAVMVRCYLLCLLTLALCCASGLVWADSPKASDALIKPSTVGVPSLVRRAIPAQEEEGFWLHHVEEEDGEDEEHLSASPSCGDSSNSPDCRKSVAAERTVSGKGLKQEMSEREEYVKTRQELERANSELETTQAKQQVHQRKVAENSKQLSPPEAKLVEMSLDPLQSSPDQLSEQASSLSPHSEEPPKLISEVSSKPNTDDTLNSAVTASGKPKEGLEVAKGQRDPGSGGAPSQLDEGSAGPTGGSSGSHPSTHTHNNTTPADPDTAISTPASPAADDQTGNTGSSTAGETAAHHGNKAPQPSSSNKPDTGNAGESETSTTESGTASAQSESSSNQ